VQLKCTKLNQKGKKNSPEQILFQHSHGRNDSRFSTRGSTLAFDFVKEEIEGAAPSRSFYQLQWDPLSLWYQHPTRCRPEIDIQQPLVVPVLEALGSRKE
jgi:hypothetical protein